MVVFFCFGSSNARAALAGLCLLTSWAASQMTSCLSALPSILYTPVSCSNQVKGEEDEDEALELRETSIKGQR